MPLYDVEMSTTVYLVVKVEADSNAEAKLLATRDLHPQGGTDSLEFDFDHGTVESCDTRDSEITVHSVDRQDDGPEPQQDALDHAESGGGSEMANDLMADRLYNY